MLPRLIAFLSTFLFCFLPAVRAQFALQQSSWQGVMMPPIEVPVRLTFGNDSLSVVTVAGAPIATMRFEQSDDTLRLRTTGGQIRCGTSVIGTYRVVYVNNGEGFVLQPIADDCIERQNSFDVKKPFVRDRASEKQPPRNWSYLDPTTDSVAGMSLYKAYELLKGRPSVPVVVGVLDSGVDQTHEDLRDVIWVNPKEIPDNATDDDKNGYADDVNGWNFMGAKNGLTYQYDQPEITQTYILFRNRFDTPNPDTLSATAKRQYATYQQAKKIFLQRYQGLRFKRAALTDTALFWRATQRIAPQLSGQSLSPLLIRRATVGTDSVAMAVRELLATAYNPAYGAFGRYLDLIRINWPLFRSVVAADVDIAYNPDYNVRSAVGDNPANPDERYYGNPRMEIDQSDVLAVHGSHVAGIIGARRNNGRGIDGVADNVQIMPVSVVPANGDERDKDVVNGIRYAVENGAKVINMSFGKRLSPYKEQIDAAIRFAEERDVLIVHAAGNNGENYDSLPAYPSARYENGQTAQNVVVVGNSTWRVNEALPSRSSNYGTQTVDLFAPGTDILSTLPNNRYASFSGTSMAAPATAGVAALLRSYFPKLTAVQVRDILLKSTYKPDVQVRQPGRSGQLVPFSSLSRSGGLLNAYEAVKMAIGQ